MLTFTITATDNDPGTTTAPTATVTVRINVAPTDIQFTGTGDINNAAGNLSKVKMTPTALTIADGDDADSDPDPYTIAENVENQPQVNLGTIDVMDQNLAGATGTAGDPFGTHTFMVSDSRFDVVSEVASGGADDGNGSTWVLILKEDATFDYEKDGDKKGTLTVTVTAKDGGGLTTVGHFTIQISDEEEEAPTTPTPTTPADPEVPGLEDDAEDSDDDGPVIPPDDGGAFIDEDDLIGLTIDDDLLGDFVLAIDDIDVA